MNIDKMNDMFIKRSVENQLILSTQYNFSNTGHLLRTKEISLINTLLINEFNNSTS